MTIKNSCPKNRAAVQRVDELPGSVLPATIVLTDQVGGVEGQHDAGGNVHGLSSLYVMAVLPGF